MIEDRDGLTLSQQRSHNHPAQHISDPNFADNTVLLSDIISEAELLLRMVETAARSIGLGLDAEKTQAWIAVHTLHKVWSSPFHRQSKQRVFKTTVESILLYG